MMSPMSQFNASQIRVKIEVFTFSPRDIFATVKVERPVALRKSVLFMSLSISNFQSF